MLNWQSMLLKTDMLANDTVCNMARMYFDSFEYPENVDKDRLKETLDRAVGWYCSFNPVRFVEELNSKTNFETLLYQVC